MEKFPRGSLPPTTFPVSTLTPPVVRTAPSIEAAADQSPACDLGTKCPTCMIEMQPEHAHYRCLRCGYRDACCF
jgi:hypothetical protein